MSTSPDGTSSRTDSTAPYVISRRSGPLAAGLAAVVVLIVLVAWVALSSGSVGLYVLGLVVAAVLGVFAVLLAFELFKAGTPLLVADAHGLSTGPGPSVRMTWEETERVRILDRGWRGAAVGLVPADLGAAVTSSRPNAANSDQIAAMLRKREKSQGAPIMISLRFAGVDAAAVTSRLTALSAGRTAITG